jgi:hypothetical protein
MINHVQSEARSPGSHLQTSGSSAQQQGRAKRWARWGAGAKALRALVFHVCEKISRILNLVSTRYGEKLTRKKWGCN